ncbi:MAG: single-stranded-DNA-specific exonuclease RecJ, partial [Lachnospiraceae bacterium]|nr:single-stranded-DNA-specific exonuclease RecJ [Lachnospiraceae bacterium]
MLLKKGADYKALSSRLGIDQVIARIILNKNIKEEDMEKYLRGKLSDIYSPFLLNDMQKAVDILKQKIAEKKKIRIVGDYDIDGVQSTYILYDALKNLGADVSYAIPDRIIDGYGINENLIKKAYLDKADTVLTCDNGISAFAPIELAKEYGMTVIVTDHHDIPTLEDGETQKLVSADAVVNPKIKSEKEYPFKDICGAVVAWKLMIALYSDLGRSDDIVSKYLENAAFATVGDVMDLADENRIIVRHGLEALKRTDNPGMSALMKRKQIDRSNLKAYHIGFVLGPCINASGRLETAEKSLQLLMAKNEIEADALAEELVDLNETRKEMTAKGEEAAFEAVETSDLFYDRVLVVYLPELHESLAGIVAGRVRERYGKPSFVLTKTDNDMIRGSGRSIETYPMFENLQKCDSLLEKYGGHPMAAGLSLKEENIDEFRKTINEICTLSEDELTEKVYIDMQMP